MSSMAMNRMFGFCAACAQAANKNKQPRPEDVVLLVPPRGGPWCAPRGGTLNPHPVAVSINLLEEVPLLFMFLFAFLVLNVSSDILFIQANGIYTIARSPKMVTPIGPFL